MIRLNDLFGCFFYEGVLSKHGGFQGLTRYLGACFFADDVNEQGITAAALFFEGYAKYETTKKK